MTTLCDASAPSDSARQRIDAESRLAEVHAAHARPLMRFLLSLTGNDRHAAEDLLQETMLKAWRRWDFLPEGDENVRRWLFTIGRRASIDAARRRRTRPPEVTLLDKSATAPSEDLAGAALARDALTDAFKRLSDDHRQVLQEIHFNGLRVEEAAGRLKIPVGTAKSRMHYAMRILRTAVNSHGPVM